MFKKKVLDWCVLDLIFGNNDDNQSGGVFVVVIVFVVRPGPTWLVSDGQASAAGGGWPVESNKWNSKTRWRCSCLLVVTVMVDERTRIRAGVKGVWVVLRRRSTKDERQTECEAHSHKKRTEQTGPDLVACG